MFEKFGEFGSYEELDRAARAQKDEGDLEALKALAKENGIDEEDAEDFFNGDISQLCSPAIAAMGKLDLEKEDLNLSNVLLDWVGEVKRACLESTEMAKGVRTKGRDLAGYIAMLADEGYEHMAMVDKRIVAKTKKVKGVVGNHPFSIGIPDKATRKRIMTEYYTGRKVSG